MLDTKTIATGPRPGIQERLAPILASPAGRRGLWILGGVVVAAGLATNWSWLTAIGIAPLLVAAAPCLVMCALGLCMMGRNSKSCSTNSAPNSANAPSETSRVVANANDLKARPSTPAIPPAASPAGVTAGEALPVAVSAIDPAVLPNETTVATETKAQPTEERKLTHA